MEKGETLTPRKLKALQTKKIIFETAKQLFAEKGYTNVSIDDITTRAGTSKGTFYLYFKNKEHIMLEQYKIIETFHAQTYKNLPKELTAKEKLLTFVKEQQSYATETFGLDLLKILYYTQLTPDKEKFSLVDEHRVLYDIIRKIIRQGQKAGEFRKDFSCREITNLVTFWVRSIIYDWCIQDGQFDLVEQGQRLFKMFVDEILSPRPCLKD